MSTITAILEPDADGTLHLPLPPEWRECSIRVKAEMEPVEELKTPRPGGLKGFWMAADFDEPLADFQEYTE